MSLVGLIKVESENDIKDGILRALDLIQYEFPPDVKKVVIKPNLCYYWDYTTGETTHPKFVASLIYALRERLSRDLDISIAESDASAMKCEHAFRILGYEKLSRDHDVALVNLSEDKSDNVEVKVAGQSFRFMIPRTIRNADLKISVPKIKYTFEQIKLTCALKNVFGCNPYPKKFKYHTRIDEVIVALNKAIKFDLCLVDGIIVSGAKPRRMGLVMSCRDPVATDVVAAKIAGLNSGAIKYVSLAAKEGVGNMRFIEKGTPVSYFEARYPRKDAQKIIMGKAYGLVLKTGLGPKLGLN